MVLSITFLFTEDLSTPLKKPLLPLAHSQGLSYHRSHPLSVPTSQFLMALLLIILLPAPPEPLTTMICSIHEITSKITTVSL